MHIQVGIFKAVTSFVSIIVKMDKKWETLIELDVYLSSNSKGLEIAFFETTVFVSHPLGIASDLWTLLKQQPQSIPRPHV